MDDWRANPCLPLADGLLPAAMRVEQTRGRCHPEPEHPFRSPFQRDRDRIIHSAAFRRLEYKTQVFVNGEGDNYRTRLTHTLEVTQIARTIARTLHINEDLAEAVALSHDLGHTPFGHAGERQLDALLAGSGGFNHNRQGLRVVDALEKRYGSFDGLNLCFEVREAFIRHGGPAVAVGLTEFSPADSPLLEVAATMAADDIAYIAHDIDDGLYSGILNADQLGEVDLWRQATGVPGFSSFPDSLKRTEGVRRLINLLVTDLIDTSRANLDRTGIFSVVDVRGCGAGIINFSAEIEEKKSALKQFLFSNFYRHPNVMRVMEEAQGMLAGLYRLYTEKPEKMPMEYQKIADMAGIDRAAADYIAGMTDRFARDDWNRLKNNKKVRNTEKKD